MFYNHERYRIYQHKAIFRSILSSIFVLPLVFNVMNGGSKGIDFVRRKPLIAGPLSLVYFTVNFYIWNRVVGFRSEDYMCHIYAKNHKMLRNILIQQ